MAQFVLTTILCSLLHYIAFQRLAVASVEDHVLFPDQTLVIEQTLVSQNQVFEMGFFSPGKFVNRFLGIWYKSTPDIVVWIANRNNPINDSQGVAFMISRNGSLVISRDASIIWSTTSSRVVTNPVLQLLDTGNLVVVGNTTEGYAWQSFNHPTDTLLPGMKLINDTDSGQETYLTSWRTRDDPSTGEFLVKIENLGLADVVTLSGVEKRYRMGKWNGIYFCGAPLSPNKRETVFKEERMVSIGEQYDGSVLTRITLDTSGVLVRHTMNARRDKWNLVFTFPQDMCDEYGICGPNGICRSRIDKLVRCQCIKGFAPKLQKNWDLQDWSDGCTRTKPLNCEGGDGFLEIRGVKYPDMLRFQLNTTMSLAECKVECFRNSSCTAYANPFITNGGSGCLMWYGDLIDTKELSAPDSIQNIYIRVPVSELEQNGRTLLTWPKRYDIIIGIARGLLYLHHDSRLKIIHRDLKTSNILLDKNLTPKISDFGLARIFEEDQSLARTKRVVGTYGYMAPEYAIDGKYSVKSDVFSLGVVLLEIISGKKNRGFEHCDHYLNLLGHAWLLWKENKILKLMDECLNDTFMESQVKRCMQVGLLCVQKFAEDRPTMAAVVSMLGTDEAILPEPKEPGFFIERSSSLVTSCASPSLRSENGTITITDLEAR